MKILEALKNIGGGILRFVFGNTGKVIGGVCKFFTSVSSAVLSFVKLRRAFRKHKVKEVETADDVVKTERTKKEVKIKAKDIINRDQDIDQDDRENRYSDEEIKDSGVAKCLREYRRKRGFNKVEPEIVSADQSSTKKEDYYQVVDTQTGKIVFFKKITQSCPRERCRDIYKILKRQGYINGLWSSNPYRPEAEALYGC